MKISKLLKGLSIFAVAAQAATKPEGGYADITVCNTVNSTTNVIGVMGFDNNGQQLALIGQGTCQTLNLGECENVNSTTTLCAFMAINLYKNQYLGIIKGYEDNTFTTNIYKSSPGPIACISQSNNEFNISVPVDFDCPEPSMRP